MTDVATRAGVSTMTVSNVINRPELVTEQTQAKVHDAMRELNYRNNLVARSLRLTEPRQIGYSASPTQDPTSSYMSMFTHDLALACQARGRNLTLIAEEIGDNKITTYEDLFYGRSVAGYVLSCVEVDDPRHAMLNARGIPFVSYGQTSSRADVPWSWVDGDAARGIVMAVEHVIAAGHVELSYLGFDQDDIFALDRHAGYIDACRRHNLGRSVQRDRVVAVDENMTAGLAATHRLLAQPYPPTAIICASDSTAAGAVLAAREAGLEPGRDLAITGFNDSPLTDFGDVGITSVRQHTENIANELVELLIEPPTDPRHLLIKPELIIRSSTSR